MIQESNHISIEFGVAVEDDIVIRTPLRESFPQLQHNSLGGRMSGDVKVQHATATVLDDQEAVQQLKRQESLHATSAVRSVASDNEARKIELSQNCIRIVKVENVR